MGGVAVGVRSGGLLLRRRRAFCVPCSARAQALSAAKHQEAKSKLPGRGPGGLAPLRPPPVPVPLLRFASLRVLLCARLAGLRCACPSFFRLSGPAAPLRGFGPGGLRRRGLRGPLARFFLAPAPALFFARVLRPLRFRCGGVLWLLRPPLPPVRCALWLCSAFAAAPSVRPGALFPASVSSPLPLPSPSPLGRGRREAHRGAAAPAALAGDGRRLPRGASPGAVLPSARGLPL